MMKSMQSWAAAHGLLYTPPLPFTVEQVHPPDMVDFGDDSNPADDWCDTCHNMGVVDCHCGGDLCICLHHGEKPCPDCDNY